MASITNKNINASVLDGITEELNKARDQISSQIDEKDIEISRLKQQIRDMNDKVELAREKVENALREYEAVKNDDDFHWKSDAWEDRYDKRAEQLRERDASRQDRQEKQLHVTLIATFGLMHYRFLSGEAL